MRESNELLNAAARQGGTTEFGFVWTIVLDQSGGSMSTTLVNREATVVLLGACTAQ